MSAVAILEEARSLGVNLRVEGDRIKAKGPRPSVERLLPALRQHKPELLAALAKLSVTPATSPDPAECSGHWLISLPSQRLERWFFPGVTRAELEARHPGAALVALPEVPAGPVATPDEEAELKRLIAAVAAREGFSEGETVEALSSALHDPANALRCFRALLSIAQA